MASRRLKPRATPLSNKSKKSGTTIVRTRKKEELHKRHTDTEFAHGLIQKWVGAIVTHMVRSRNTVLRKEIAPWFEQVMRAQGKSLSSCYMLKNRPTVQPKLPQALQNMLPDVSIIQPEDLCAAIVLFYIRGWLYARSTDASKRDYASFTGLEGRSTDFYQLMSDWVDDVNLKLTRHIKKKPNEAARIPSAGAGDEEEEEDEEETEEDVVRRPASSRDVRRRRRENVFVPEEDITQTEIYYPNSIINEIPNCFAAGDRRIFGTKPIEEDQEEYRAQQLSILGVPNQYAKERDYADSLKYPSELRAELFPLTLESFQSPCAVVMLWNFYQLVKKPPDRRKILLPVGLNRANVTDEYKALVRPERAALLLRQAIMFYTSGYCMIQSGLILNSEQIDRRVKPLTRGEMVRVETSKKPVNRDTEPREKPKKKNKKQADILPTFKQLNETALKKFKEKNWVKLKQLEKLITAQDTTLTSLLDGQDQAEALELLKERLEEAYGDNVFLEAREAMEKAASDAAKAKADKKAADKAAEDAAYARFNAQQAAERAAAAAEEEDEKEAAEAAAEAEQAEQVAAEAEEYAAYVEAAILAAKGDEELAEFAKELDKQLEVFAEENVRDQVAGGEDLARTYARAILQQEQKYIKDVKAGHEDSVLLTMRLKQLAAMQAKLKPKAAKAPKAAKPTKPKELKGVVKGSSLIVRGFGRVFNLTNAHTVTSHQLKPDKRRKNKDRDAVVRAIHRCAIFRTPSALKVLLVDGAELHPEPVPPCDIFMDKTSAASALLLAYMELVDFMFSPSAPLLTREQLLTVEGYWGPDHEPFGQGEMYNKWSERHKLAFRDAYRFQMKKWTNVGFQPTGERSRVHGMPLMNWNDWAPGKNEFANPWRVREDNYFRLLMKYLPPGITNRLGMGARAVKMWAKLETTGPFGTNRRPPIPLFETDVQLYDEGISIERRQEEPSKMNRKRQDMRERVSSAINDISEHFTDAVRAQLGVEYYRTAFLTEPDSTWKGTGIKVNDDCMFPQPKRPLGTFNPPALFNMNTHPLTDTELGTSMFQPIPNMPDQWFVYPLNRLDAGLINGQQFRSGVSVTPRSDQTGFIVDYDITLRKDPAVWDLTVPLKKLVGPDFKCKKNFEEPLDFVSN